MKRCIGTLLALVVVCLSVNVWGLEVSEARRLSNPRLQAAMRRMSNDELVAFCKAVFESSDQMLKSRVKIQLQNLLRSRPSAESKALMETLNQKVPQLNFAVSSDGRVVVVVGDPTTGATPGAGTYVPRGDGDSKPVSKGANRTNI